MRCESAMDVAPAELAVQEALRLELPQQETMDKHYLENMCTLDVYKLTNCEGVHCMANNDEDKRDQSDVKIEDLQPCQAMCCAIQSCYCKFPECLGCVSDGTVLFCQGRCVSLKPLDCKDDDKRCCAVCEMNAFWKIPTEFGESKCQCCCIDQRMAIPCNDDVPCMFTPLPCCVCGLNCDLHHRADFGMSGPHCCKKVGDIIPRLKK
eukprot:g8666.t1